MPWFVPVSYNFRVNSFLSSGHYLYLKVLENEFFDGEIVSVASARTKARNFTQSLSFSMYTSPVNQGTIIKLYQYFGDYDQVPFSKVRPRPSTAWQMYNISLPASTRPYGIIFEATLATGSDVEIAIDDISRWETEAVVSSGKFNLFNEVLRID